jgi:hypothetical protein
VAPVAGYTSRLERSTTGRCRSSSLLLALACAAKEVRSAVLVELGLVEQRHGAVLEVLDGAKITDVAVLCGVSRKTGT